MPVFSRNVLLLFCFLSTSLLAYRCAGVSVRATIIRLFVVVAQKKSNQAQKNAHSLIFARFLRATAVDRSLPSSAIARNRTRRDKNQRQGLGTNVKGRLACQRVANEIEIECVFRVVRHRDSGGLTIAII